MILLIIHNHYHMLNKNYSDETKKLKAFIDEYEDQTDDSKSFEKQGTPAITARGEATVSPAEIWQNADEV